MHYIGPSRRFSFKSLRTVVLLRAQGLALWLGMTIALTLTWSARADDEIIVVASIKPIHSIVSAIMDGVGEPHLIMKGAASPHTFNLRPSDARALHNSDVVFQVGHALEASLADTMWTLAERAEIISLSHATKLVKLPFREGGMFESHQHDHGHSHEGEHASTTSLSEHHSHGAAETGVAGVASTPLLADEVDETFDMHIWLDPQNGRVIAEVVASVLMKNDGRNKDVYTRNLTQFLAAMDELQHHLENELGALSDRPFIAYHDAYHYFEDRFDLLAVGSAVVVPGRSAGARRIQEIRQRIAELGVVCVFSEPQFDNKLIETIIEGTDVKVSELDPLGASLEDGKSLYSNLLRDMGHVFSDCLTPVS